MNDNTILKLQTNEDRNAKRRRDIGVFITQKCVLGINTIQLLKNRDPDFYSIGIFLVERQSTRKIVKSQVTNKLSYEEGLWFVMNSFKQTEGVEDDVMTISLKCPYTMTFMRTPCRGIHCQHTQCFDMESFVEMQKSSLVNQWRCPICRGYAFALQVDVFMQEIQAQSMMRDDDPSKAAIYPDGSYRILSFSEYQEKDYKSSPLIHPKSNPTKPILSNRIVDIPKKKPRLEPVIQEPVRNAKPFDELTNYQGYNRQASTPSGSADIPIELD